MEIEPLPDGAFFPVAWTGQHRIRVFTVTGGSLEADGLSVGDCLIVEERDLAEDGELVIAQVRGGEPMLRRISIGEDHVSLASPSPASDITLVAPQELTLHGVVAGILRKHPG